MYNDRSRPPHFDTANQSWASSAGAENTPGIVMHQAVDEDGISVRVTMIMPRYPEAGDGSDVVESLPQWFTERGERMVLLCDSHFEVVGTHRKLRIVGISAA